MRPFRVVPLLLLSVLFVDAPSRGNEATVERGATLYDVYCFNCHGSHGRGDGPTGVFLKVRPTDLTRLAEKNGGSFPDDDVYRAIDGRERLRGHGSREMPIWGLSFQDLDQDTNQEVDVERKIRALVAYLKTLQRPPRSVEAD